MMPTLDVEAVRAFVMVADLQSFTRAAEALGTTQGAISVKLKRLEDRLGHRLIERTPRSVRLSAQGAGFLDGAREFIAAHERAVAGLNSPPRRFALGIAAHVAGPEVPTLLARLHAHDPNLTIEVQLDSSRNLLDLFDQGRLDAAIIQREDDRRDGETLVHDRFGWFAAQGFEHRQGEPLRLAALNPTCGVRNLATRALDAAGIGWTEVFLGGRFFCRPRRRGGGAGGRSVVISDSTSGHCRCRRAPGTSSASVIRRRTSFVLDGPTIAGGLADLGCSVPGASGVNRRGIQSPSRRGNARSD
jgi:DNA-binding transcriptional LysR family regulator